MKTTVYLAGRQRTISHTHIEQYLAAGWTQEPAAEKKTKTRVAVVATEDQSSTADSGSPEALASVTTQAQPGDIILNKGDE